MRRLSWTHQFGYSPHKAGVAAALLATVLLLPAEESQVSPPQTTEPPRLFQDPVAAATSAASVPLPDPTPKPVVLPAAEVLDCVEYVLPGEGRSVIVQKIEPPQGYIPPPVSPQPQPLQPAAPSEEFLARARAASANRALQRHLHFSATVYTAPNGFPATLVRWAHDGKIHTAWSSIDWNHFRGLDRFESHDGKTHYWMMLGIGDATKAKARAGHLVPPVFGPGEITFRILDDGPPEQAAIADLETLHELYRSDGQRLKLAHEIREKAIMERQAWLQANPPQPRDIIVRHWDVPTTRPSPPTAPATGMEMEARP